MSTIEERIEKHKQALMHAEMLFTKYTDLREKWDNKYRFHNNAIFNLEAKKAKQTKAIEAK